MSAIGLHRLGLIVVAFVLQTALLRAGLPGPDEAQARPSLVLIGDAAHAGPPHMGEGGCMAMEDALVLVDVLRKADRLDTALEAYVRRRRLRADWVQAQSRAAAQAWVLSPAARNAALRERGDQMFRDRYRPLISPP
jgi:2-polyprenyl-6-methoxyphenol hydroxylase-like FAD-dependent oxidoreductase